MSKEEAETIEDVGLTMKTLLGFGLSYSLIVNLFVGSNMNKLLGAVKNLQILVHFTLMRVVMPANSQVFMSVIFALVTFDMFDPSTLTETFYTPIDDVEVDERLVQLGYDSAFCLINLGSCLYLIFVQICIVILETLFLACFRLKCWHGRSHKTSVRADKCRRWFEKQLNGVFWNSILTTIDGAQLVFMFNAAINIKN